MEREDDEAAQDQREEIQAEVDKAFEHLMDGTATEDDAKLICWAGALKEKK